ncbi:DUF4451 domain-containing protein [Candidatus Bathyarchaeota archaeon]|nr:DUF4451 domain-containing protein [Candidatus Bathyarchaeota archaeon]
MSTSGGLSDMPSYEDFSAALSDGPSSFGSDYPPPSNRNSLMSSTQLSPVASPRMSSQGRSELARTHSRGRASPSPRPPVRTAPYSVDMARNKRWSTGSYGPGANRRPSPLVYHPGTDMFGAQQRMSSRHSSPTMPNNHLPLNYGNLQATQQPQFMIPNAPMYHRNSMLLPSQMPSHLPSQGFAPGPHHHFEAPPPLLSHGLFRMLQSNADPHSLHGHYADLAEPPDLFAALHEEQIPPPPEDMNPSDPDLVPHEQELRFEGDLYTPRWVRGHGNKREGWCGICKPGRWLVLKNSAYWYDKSFTHGISAATGSPFQEPLETRRMDGNPDVWEGLCGGCNDWVALVSSKKKGTTWFRHAYKVSLPGERCPRWDGRDVEEICANDDAVPHPSQGQGRPQASPGERQQGPCPAPGVEAQLGALPTRAATAAAASHNPDTDGGRQWRRPAAAYPDRAQHYAGADARAGSSAAHAIPAAHAVHAAALPTTHAAAHATTYAAAFPTTYAAAFPTTYAAAHATAHAAAPTTNPTAATEPTVQSPHGPDGKRGVWCGLGWMLWRLCTCIDTALFTTVHTLSFVRLSLVYYDTHAHSYPLPHTPWKPSLADRKDHDDENLDDLKRLGYDIHGGMREDTMNDTFFLLFSFLPDHLLFLHGWGGISVSVPGDEEVFAGGKGIRAANSFVLWLEGYLVSALVYTCFCSVTYPGASGAPF